MASSSNQIHELFLRHQKDVFAYILTLVPNRNDAEDVYQQTCLALLEKQAEYDLGREFFPWACGFALNEVRRFRRAHYRERTQLDDAVIESLASGLGKESLEAGAHGFLAKPLRVELIRNKVDALLSGRKSVIIPLSVLTVR